MASAKLDKALSKTFDKLKGKKVGSFVDASGLYLNQRERETGLNNKQAPGKPGVALL
ncbi:MAG: hypothetical protein NUV80_02625 [Candidatus Berkelbacteria bacterium]|nr:hypothetical protein [Candidatus Berkelbacteria bacterium]MCR4307428.1 hypothetical protein [Candidatus Berkelbacteria bacterium]